MATVSPILPDKQQTPPLARCDRCQGEMYQGDTLYTWDGTKICGECMEEKFNCMTTAEKAALLGSEMVQVGE